MQQGDETFERLVAEYQDATTTQREAEARKLALRRAIAEARPRGMTSLQVVARLKAAELAATAPEPVTAGARP